jgi:hypothetical protein
MLTDQVLPLTSASTFASAERLISLLTAKKLAKVRVLKHFGVVPSINSAIEWLNINTKILFKNIFVVQKRHLCLLSPCGCSNHRGRRNETQYFLELNVKYFSVSATL